MISLDDLKSLSFTELNKWGIPVSKYNCFPDYYQKYVDSRNYCLYYKQYSEFLWATGDGRFKFLEIAIGSDVVCIFFKSIFFTIKLYDFPVSRGGIDDNEVAVMRVILNSGYSSSFVLDERRVFEKQGWFRDVGTLKRDYTSDNFYSSLKYVEDKICSRKYRSKYGIQRLEEHYSVRVLDSLTTEDIEVAEGVYNSWSKTNSDPKELKEFKGMLRYNSPNIKYFFHYFDSTPVGISIILICSSDYFIEEFCYTDAKTEFVENPEKHALLHKIVFYIKYQELKFVKDYKKIDNPVIYCLSAGPSKGLYNNKLENNEGIIKYYTLNDSKLLV